ncbi:MAG: DUF554 domain-containing protein [Actinomycetota bacterium]|nr:DUF554 domain-containing protein [Actinomycetota bacterium]
MIGLGTVINIIAILIGSAIGVALGHRLPQRTRDVVTDGLGLLTLLVAALSAAAVLDPSVSEAVGAAGILIVLGSLLIGGIIGSLLSIEARLEGLGERIRRRLSRRVAVDELAGSGSRADMPVDDPTEDAIDVEVEGALADPDPVGPDADGSGSTFVEGFVTASLVFCVGPLAILGALSDGLGLGIDQLALKSVMDGFASIAFAASLGWGVAASALVVGVYQGTLTLLGWGLGSVLSLAQISLLTATGGLLLVGIALRLLRIRHIPVGDLLPALIVAPILTAIVAAFS